MHSDPTFRYIVSACWIFVPLFKVSLLAVLSVGIVLKMIRSPYIVFLPSRLFSAGTPSNMSLVERLTKFYFRGSCWYDRVSFKTEISIPTSLNPFFPNAPFLYPLKPCFHWAEKGCSGNEWVNKVFIHWVIVGVNIGFCVSIWLKWSWFLFPLIRQGSVTSK